MKEELLHKEREYITILGIFASIVLAFVGGATFSTSVLENINKVNFYRLVIVISLIGIVFFDIISALLFFIGKINKLDKKEKGTKKGFCIIFLIVNLFFVIIIGLTIWIWLTNPALFFRL